MISSTHNLEIIAPVDSKDAEIDMKEAEIRSSEGNGALETEKVAEGVAKIDIKEAYTRRFKKNQTLDEIGNHFGVSHQAVSKALSRFSAMFEKRDELKIYQKNRGDIIDFAEMEALTQAVAKLPEANAYQAGAIWKRFFDGGRIEKGKLTGIVGMVHATPETLEAYGKAAIVINQSRLTDAKKEELEAVTADSDNYEETGVSD